MSSTPPPTAKTVPIETTFTITVKSSANGEMNAAGFKSQLDNAIELKKTISDGLPQGSTVEGTVKIGKQKFPL